MGTLSEHGDDGYRPSRCVVYRKEEVKTRKFGQIADLPAGRRGRRRVQIFCFGMNRHMRAAFFSGRRRMRCGINRVKRGQAREWAQSRNCQIPQLPKPSTAQFSTAGAGRRERLRGKLLTFYGFNMERWFHCLRTGTGIRGIFQWLSVLSARTLHSPRLLLLGLPRLQFCQHILGGTSINPESFSGDADGKRFRPCRKESARFWLKYGTAFSEVCSAD